MVLCDVCGRALPSEAAAGRHPRRPSLCRRQPRCPLCAAAVGCDELRRHMETAHPEPGPPGCRSPGAPPECPFCGEAAGRELEEHVRARHGHLLGAPGTGERRGDGRVCPRGSGLATENRPGDKVATKEIVMYLDAGNGEQLYECPMCSLTCTNIQILEEHVDLHLEEHNFSEGGNIRDLELAQQLQTEEDEWQRSEEEKREREEFQKLQRQYGLDNSGGFKQQFLNNMEREVDRGRMQPFEYHKRKADMMESLASGVDDGRTKTSGVIEALCKYYQSENKDVRRVWLSAGVDHFHSSLGDRGWGCGYRNFQMLLSSLLQNSFYNDCLRASLTRSMIPIKWWLHHWNLLWKCQRCQIIDFHKPTGPMGTHPRLFEWILHYYSTDNEGGAKVVCTSKPPIYLQHQGHSRTVVGIEEKKNKSLCLLLFDPGCSSQQMQKLLKQNSDGSGLRLLRKFVGSLKEKQYQIVAVDGVLSLEEKAARCRASQVLTSEKIP
ncbi:zinc finger-containing ubiquitin peptidase 1 isoform X2 [Pyrgilauda ruficollis]|uniref:zinc finger-containing ubiquitin peptidase 1 isoform X2 n=1 Tax=Pyrgilauda ruficollis TaxID=221976 RepID=UPI001B87E767|nr:zinc finger-containing ubiquitin peptidase 1 isoform X2 [Pyrgilauda ruficollis]